MKVEWIYRQGDLRGDKTLVWFARPPASYLFDPFIDRTDALTDYIRLAQSCFFTANLQNPNIFIRHSNSSFVSFGVCGGSACSRRQFHHLFCVTVIVIILMVTQMSRRNLQLIAGDRYGYSSCFGVRIRRANNHFEDCGVYSEQHSQKQESGKFQNREEYSAFLRLYDRVCTVVLVYSQHKRKNPRWEI